MRASLPFWPPPLPPGKVYQNENGDVADDSYNKWKTDIQLMTDMKGLNAFRFSIAWARIIQLDGTVNPAGIAHYNALIGEGWWVGLCVWRGGESPWWRSRLCPCPVCRPGARVPNTCPALPSPHPQMDCLPLVSPHG